MGPYSLDPSALTLSLVSCLFLSSIHTPCLRYKHGQWQLTWLITSFGQSFIVIQCCHMSCLIWCSQQLYLKNPGRWAKASAFHEDAKAQRGDATVVFWFVAAFVYLFFYCCEWVPLLGNEPFMRYLVGKYSSIPQVTFSFINDSLCCIGL